MIRVSILLILIVIFLNTQAKTLTLDQCLNLAYERNLQLQEEQKNVEKTRLLIGTAFDVSNTSVELSQDATGGGSMENGLKFSQEFEFPTIYIARRKALNADYSIAQALFKEKKNGLCGNVISGYYTLLFHNKKISVLERLVKYYSQFAKIALDRYNAGETSRLEYINADRLKAKSEINLKNARLDANSSNLYLMSLIGIDESIEPAEKDLPILNMPEILDEISPQYTYRGQLMNFELKRSERNLSIAKQEFLPGIFVSATSQFLINGFNPYNIDRTKFEKGDFMGFQVGITVPLFFGAKRAKLLAAKRDVEIAQLRIENENTQINKEYAKAKTEFATAYENLRYYEQKGLEQANEITRLAQISYELGEIDYIEYIQNIEIASSLELEYLESIEKYNQTVIRLQTIKGIL